METSTLHLLVEQVREHLKRLPSEERVRELIYSHFLPQCDQYEVTEDQFYKLILKAAFKEATPAPEEDPDPPNRKGTFVKVFGVTLHSLQRLGEVLFEDPAREKIYFEDVTFLKAHVDALADADLAMSYAELYKTEPNPEHRYLKICYRLNPKLPYRLDGREFVSIEEMLTEGFANRNLFNKIYKDYVSGRLHIWLQEQDLECFTPKSEIKTVNAFLIFVYQVNPDYPIYIEKELFRTPQELVARALSDLKFWKPLLASAANEDLFIWFDARGYIGWRKAYQSLLNDIRGSALFLDEEKDYAAVQQLLYIIDPDLAPPLLVASQDEIVNLSLAATKILTIPIWISLKSAGFTKPNIRLLPEWDGITIDQSQLVLFNLTGQKQGVVHVTVDPQKLKKNKEYLSSLQIITPYQTVDLPIKIKSVFPIKALLFCIAKYSLFGALFLGCFRWLLAGGIRSGGSLPQQIITTSVGRSLPENYTTFYWVFVTMLIGFCIAMWGIRKVERI